jgi:5-methylcytosine-specific restriction endonuclease McrA
MQPIYKPQGQNERTQFRRAGLIWVLGGKCADCGSTEDLQFDHIDLDGPCSAKSGVWRLAWERILADLFNLQLLCPDCHIEKSRLEQRNAQVV